LNRELFRITTPVVDIQLIEGVFDKSQKQEMIRKVTDAMVEIEARRCGVSPGSRVQEVATENGASAAKD
jgi:4-oxalocrotonate tautomerase